MLGVTHFTDEESEAQRGEVTPAPLKAIQLSFVEFLLQVKFCTPPWMRRLSKEMGLLPHWVGGGPEAQRAEVTSPEPHSQGVADPGWKQVCLQPGHPLAFIDRSLSAKA